jgi:Holliday junction DNA helicase RuvA
VIAHLAGTLLEKHLQRLVVDVNGVGYDVHVPLSTIYATGEPGSSVRLRVHTHVTDDAIRLFGFQTALELTLFERLIGVSGIGPRVALAVLSGIEPAELVRALRGGDLVRLTRIPGIGRKTAERLVLELKDRLPSDVPGAELDAREPGDDLRGDVLSALANLGYQRGSVEKTVERVLKAGDAADFETALRAVLRELAR